MGQRVRSIRILSPSGNIVLTSHLDRPDPAGKELVALSNADFSGPLMKEWQEVIRRDSRVLARRDKDGNPAPPLKYRPKQSAIEKVGLIRTPLHRGFQGQTTSSKNRRITAELHNNLSRREYLALTGPRLAPRGPPNSRVITNLATRNGHDGNRWFAVGAWKDVVSKTGVAFLHCHFAGSVTGHPKHRFRMPRYDLRGVRPEGRKEAQGCSGHSSKGSFMPENDFGLYLDTAASQASIESPAHQEHGQLPGASRRGGAGASSGATSRPTSSSSSRTRWPSPWAGRRRHSLASRNSRPSTSARSPTWGRADRPGPRSWEAGTSRPLSPIPSRRSGRPWTA